QFLYWLRSLC
ncbi:putative sET domain protein, partial [Chlamydia psittaci 84-8471/1]